jgi:hypothetical protein
VFNHYDGGRLLPYLLMAYAVATGPWAYMAKGESGDAGIGTTLPVFSACVTSLVLIILGMIHGVLSVPVLVVASVIPLAIAWIVQIALVCITLRRALSPIPRDATGNLANYRAELDGKLAEDAD